MTEREAFEAWMRDTHGPGVNLVRSDDGYISTVPHRAVRMTYASVQMLWEAWQARAQPAQAGQVLTLDEVRESVHEAGLDWHNGWTMGEDAENRYLNLCRAIEAAVLAKRVPMTPEETDAAMKLLFYPARNRAFIDGVEAAELHHGIVGKEGT